MKNLYCHFIFSPKIFPESRYLYQNKPAEVPKEKKAPPAVAGMGDIKEKEAEGKNKINAKLATLESFEAKKTPERLVARSSELLMKPIKELSTNELREVYLGMKAALFISARDHLDTNNTDYKRTIWMVENNLRLSDRGWYEQNKIQGHF